MDKSLGKRNLAFWKSMQERALSIKVEEEEKKQQVPFLDKDCISNILIRVPLESLPSSRFVCKTWYNIINSPVFIDERLRCSESVLIFLKPVPNESSYPFSSTSKQPKQQNNFSVEASLGESGLEPVPLLWKPTITGPKFSIHFVKFEDGKSKIGEYNVSCQGHIRATCNGLILLDNKLKKGGLIVMNPITRKLLALPPGTIYPPHDESYGFVFSDATGEYKVVHLFRDELGHVSCETLNIGTRCWRPVNGPAFGLFGWFGYKPVSAIEALHWIPQIDHNDYIVSMEVENDKFHTVPLPQSCRTYDRILEMGGLLCFVAHEELNIDIWKLKSLCSGDTWTKHYSICSGSVIDMFPVFGLRMSGDLIFKRDEDGSCYAYDFKLQEMRKVEMDDKLLRFYNSDTYLPHVNSFVSWMKNKVASH
ncbi:uncharacterized protein [Euphorbia lathyris]|uniref:uncharacterized protein n=1 Tax=Euphorbia lathyris TaxID=212925 RepID=UPI0033135F76